MKTVVITGANGGIGQCACERFQELNCNVIGLDIRFEKERDYDTMICDLTNEDAVKETFDKIIARYHTIDVVFHIAGGSGRRYGDGPIHECTLEGFNKTIELNLTTTFLVNKYAVQQMLKQNYGSIINTASVLGMVGGGEMFSTHTYGATKAAIIGMSRSEASLYAKNNIRVNVIAPGLIHTPMSERAQHREDIVEYMKFRQPIYQHRENKLGQPYSIVAAAEFLASDKADFVTGVVLPVDGGWTCV